MVHEGHRGLVLKLDLSSRFCILWTLYGRNKTLFLGRLDNLVDHRVQLALIDSLELLRVLLAQGSMLPLQVSEVLAARVEHDGGRRLAVAVLLSLVEQLEAPANVVLAVLLANLVRLLI